jgi:hypothetical protein
MHPEFFEGLMLVCFGCAWPVSIYKTWTTKHAKDKSIFFMVIILIGYLSGIAFEITSGIDRVLYLYLLNTLMVCVDLGLTLRSRVA